MKRNKLKSDIIYVAIIVLLAVLILITVTVQEATFVQPQKEHITVILRESDETLFLNLRLGIERAAEELGAEADIVHPILSNNHEKQIEQIELALQRQTSAIILQAADTEKSQLYFKENPLTVPLIYIENSYDSDFVGPSNSEIGIMLANGSLNEDNNHIILLQYSLTSQVINERLESCYDVLEDEEKDITILFCNTTTIFKELPKALQQTGAKTVIAFEQSATRDMLDVSLDSGIKELDLYGVGTEGDIIRGLEDKHVAGVVVWNEYAQGYTALQNAVGLTRREHELLSQNESIPFKLIRKEEIFDSENERLLFPVF